MRSFVAVELPREIREKCSKLLEGFDGLANVKWVDTENLHVTVKFLGDLSEVQVLSVSRMLRGAVKDITDFELAFAGLGAFPNNSSPRTIWIGVNDPKRCLAEISRRLEENLEQIGIPREKRAFHAHLTLGRVRSVKAPPRLAETLVRNKDFRAGEMVVREIVFMRSDLTPRGPVYMPIERVALAAREEATEAESTAG